MSWDCRVALVTTSLILNIWFAKLKLNKNKESVKVIFVEGSPHKYQGSLYLCKSDQDRQ